MQAHLRNEIESRFWRDIFETISKARLQPYIDSPRTKDQWEALTLYMYNATVSESLYVPLQNFEVGLRNRLHAVLTDKFGTDKWYEQEAERFASERKSPVHDAISEVEKRKVDGEFKPGDIVAELNLGFWHSVFSEKFRSLLWPSYIFKVFPSAPHTHGNEDEQERIYQRVVPTITAIKDLRNRVYHYEPVVWNTTRLTSLYHEITLITSWMSPDLMASMRVTARYQEVMDIGREHFQQECRKKIEAYLDRETVKEGERAAIRDARKAAKQAEKRKARLAKKEISGDTPATD
jgi:hypothetical protein